MNQEIKKLIDNYIKSQNGKIYSPIPHPMLESYESIHKNRSSIIIEKTEGIKEFYDIKTGLDIGSHWGEMCYILEDLNIEMTGIESYVGAYKVLTELKNDCKRKFNTINGDVLNMKEIRYDLIIALNIFHHFIKTEEKYNKWIKMLNRIDCKVMFFQSHNTNETQMINSYKNFNPDEFVNVILDNSCLNKSEKILNINRPIYMLTI